MRSDATRGNISWHIASYRKPLIGAINGLAFGGAALLSSSLDIRIGCEKTQFRFLAASYGRVNSTWSLPALVGIPKAKELLYTGRVVGAEEAERIGLLNQIVPSAKLREAAIEMGQMIAKNDARMVQGIKRLLHEGMGLDWRGRYDLDGRRARSTHSFRPAYPRDGFKDFLREEAGTREGRWSPDRGLLAVLRVRGQRFRGLVERPTAAFDNAVAQLVRVDVFQNDRSAVAALNRQIPAGPDRLARRDLENHLPSCPCLNP